MTRDDIMTLQQVLQSDGEVIRTDGVIGPETRRVSRAVLASYSGPRRSPLTDEETLIAAAQIVLKSQGHEPGAVDGWMGHNSRGALQSWRHAQENDGARLIVKRPVDTAYTPPRDMTRRLPHEKGVQGFFGIPGPDIQVQLTYVIPPFPFQIDWDLNQRATRLRVHSKCALPLQQALEATADHYGEERMRELGLTRYAGGYMHRKKRHGTSWSMHAYGCAVDFYAGPNMLGVRCPDALFCGPDYAPFLDIMEGHGWLSLGRMIGHDYMHFQMARVG